MSVKIDNGKCKQSAFDHNQAIFHLGQCDKCYSKVVIEDPNSEHQRKLDRKMFAVAAMQGLLSGNMDFHNRAGTPSIAELAVRHADQLLKQLEP